MPAPHTAPEASAKPAGALHHKLVRATAALKKDFAKLQSLRKLRGQSTESFDALAELVGQVLPSDPPLYVGGGYKTKEAFIVAELPGETLRSVQRNIGDGVRDHADGPPPLEWAEPRAII